jgi:type II secretory pathway pseudopilin PulG
MAHTTPISRSARRDADAASPQAPEGGFSRFEFVVAMGLITVLVLVISFSFSRVSADAVRSACASDVAAVDTAAENFATLHSPVPQLTIQLLTDPDTTTSLQSWPRAPGHAYVILIAGDRNGLVGADDARGIVIQRNDILVKVGPRIYDSTRSFATACRGT